MGNRSQPHLSRRRLSLKKGWVLRRRKLKLAKMQLNRDSKNESTDSISFAGLLPNVTNSERNTEMIHCLRQVKEEQTDDNEGNIESYNEEALILSGVTNSEINTEMTHCLPQIKEEQMDDNEGKIEAFNEEDALYGTIEYCGDNKNLIFTSVDNNVEKTEGYEEEGAHSEAIEHCENKNFVFINVDNITKNNIGETESCKKESMRNQSIEYSKDKKDIDNNCSVNTFSTQENISTSRCIVNFSYIWNEIHEIFNNHARGIDCQFKYWKLVNYRRLGLLTQFFFKCEMCHYKASIWSEPITKTPDINVAAVTANVAAGMGFSRLKQLLASMDIACMSEKTYIKYRENLVTTQKNDTKNMKNKITSHKN